MRVVIHVNWLVYLACLLSHVLRAYCNFESKQAISISLFGRRPNNNVFPMRINGVCVAVQFYILGLNFLYFCFGNGNEWYGFETKKVKPRIKMNHIINNLNKGVYLKLNHWINAILQPIPCSPNMVTARACSKLKTNWKSVAFTNKVGKNSRYFVGVFNKTIIPLALVGHEMIIANSARIQRRSWNNC